MRQPHAVGFSRKKWRIAKRIYIAKADAESTPFLRRRRRRRLSLSLSPSLASSMENPPQAPPFGFGDRRPGALGDLCVLPDEVICSILDYLSPSDVARLSCVSSAMYILCNEEPLWMSLCLNSKRSDKLLQYRGSWKETTLYLENLPTECIETCRKRLHFDGFNSLFLYRRLYRCHTTLNGFSMDSGNVERKNDISLEEFRHEYDGKKPVLLTGLADTWPAKTSWTIDQLLCKYGDTPFRISQRSSRKILMKLKDYVSYTKVQHDEDPLYIFDDNFGEAAPGLLKDYRVPHLFQEDFFDVLDFEQRPPYRWLIIGPERSGASWHVDPALTSAWNTLLCGRKRWALYPPGKVPLGVTVHVNEDDGDVNVQGPSSLQWWLDFYPLLADEDKPIECTQLPGETIFVPSGWWHCILNLETTVAVTQNFVNSKNFEFVCLDMAPGYCHKGVSRAGLLAVDGGMSGEAEMVDLRQFDTLNHSDSTRKEKRLRTQHGDQMSNGGAANGASKRNCIGQREMREWLFKLWVGKPEMRELLWKGACLALNTEKWLKCLAEICAFYKLPYPMDSERLPVGTGSNPVYLIGDHVVKIFAEEGLENAMYSLGTELEFYNLVDQVSSPLRNNIPDVLASGLLYLEDDESLTVLPWDGQKVPDIISNYNLIPPKCSVHGFPFGVWSKKRYEYTKAGMSMSESICSASCSRIWPFIITKRCKGKIYAQLRDTLSIQDTLDLAAFLGEQLRNLHMLPCPSFVSQSFSDIGQTVESQVTNHQVETHLSSSKVTAEWNIFLGTLSRKKMTLASRLTRWGDPIPSALIEKADEYIPDDLTKLLSSYKDYPKEGCQPSWIHSDIMDDNIHMEPRSIDCYNNRISPRVGCMDNGNDGSELGQSWRPSHILDFSDLSVGDPLYDLIPIHLDVFRGDSYLLKQLLQNYKIPLPGGQLQHQSLRDIKYQRLSYRAMCYCILHEENVLAAIFSIWKDLRRAESWEEVEQTVWGELNEYKGFP
ncbi:lysine-specific demethylase JMJ21 isoform X2 [Syzygium oleosum]|uniref:lysine-specific demethylase JMJ21 isoform X2 n=1 Tax=Syzygium oleosum TaxID=219896 RepID=UPI0024BAAA1E|nr:lysine-specific demethylase JMJ21 isoform X2 [Syzygium oleosum]